MKSITFLCLVLPLTISAAFDDYQNINNFLKNSDIVNEKVFVLLNNQRLLSTDYNPSIFQRVRDEKPRYPSTMIKKGIEGFVEVGFIVNEDGSTSEHKVIQSMPGEYFDENALKEAIGLRYTRNTRSDYINTKGVAHKHRFTFNLSEGSRKIPNGIFSCMQFIYEDKYLDARECSEKKIEIHRGYSIPYSMALYYLGQEDKGINILTKLLKDPNEESFYLKALTTSALTIFLFDNDLYEEILELEPYILNVRKVGYEEALLNAFYFLGVSLFYSDRTIDSLFYLKLTQQDSNCRISLRNSNDDVKASKAQSLYRLLPEKNCYIDIYNRTENTLKAIDKII